MSTRNTAVPRGTHVGPLVQIVVLALLTCALSALWPAQLAGAGSSAPDLTAHAANVNGHFGEPIVPCTASVPAGGHAPGVAPGDHPWQDAELTTPFSGDDESPGVRVADHERWPRAHSVVPQQPRGPPRLPCQP